MDEFSSIEIGLGGRAASTSPRIPGQLPGAASQSNQGVKRQSIAAAIGIPRVKAFEIELGVQRSFGVVIFG